MRTSITIVNTMFLDGVTFDAPPSDYRPLADGAVLCYDTRHNHTLTLVIIIFHAVAPLMSRSIVRAMWQVNVALA